MSSNTSTTALVPILDGTNYRQWAAVMKAFIMSTGMWAYVQGYVERAEMPRDKAERKKLTREEKVDITTSQNQWNKEDSMVIG
jgi:hypothetical protein